MSTQINKHTRTHVERIEKFLSQRYFDDVNLFGRLFKSKQQFCLLNALTNDGEKTPVEIGHKFGPTFTSHSFEVEFNVPAEWEGEEIRFEWESGCESQLIADNQYLFGFSTCEDDGLHKTFCVSECFQPEKYNEIPGCSLSADNKISLKLVVEACCLRELGEGKDGMIKPPDMEKMFSINKCHLVTVDRDAFSCYYDLQVLWQISKLENEKSQIVTEAMLAANDIINELVKSDFTRESYQAAKVISNRFFSVNLNKTNHTLHCMGHCHIDTAWLWPYNVTKSKCARSWSSAIQLMKKYTHFKFVCSQAQQLAWVKEFYPELFSKIKTFVEKGQFIIVGGTWVEMDGILPSSESMIRQFVYGQQFFKENFQVKCKEFWLPDTFGYSPSLPQIMHECGVDYFLTQKLSWSLVNKFPHHTFYWEGIDGTKFVAF